MNKLLLVAVFTFPIIAFADSFNDRKLLREAQKKGVSVQIDASKRDQFELGSILQKAKSMGVKIQVINNTADNFDRRTNSHTINRYGASEVITESRKMRHKHANQRKEW